MSGSRPSASSDPPHAPARSVATSTAADQRRARRPRSRGLVADVDRHGLAAPRMANIRVSSNDEPDSSGPARSTSITCSPPGSNVDRLTGRELDGRDLLHRHRGAVVGRDRLVELDRRRDVGRHQRTGELIVLRGSRSSGRRPRRRRPAGSIGPTHPTPRHSVHRHHRQSPLPPDALSSSPQPPTPSADRATSAAVRNRGATARPATPRPARR